MSSPEPERITSQELIRRLREDGPAVKGLCLSSVEPSDMPIDLRHRHMDVISPYPNDLLEFGMLCEALRHRATLEKLFVIGDGICEESDEKANGIATGIACLLGDANSSISEILIDDVDIKLAGAIEIGEAISKNSTLKALYISTNLISDEGGRAIANGLRQHTSIEKVTVEHGQFSDSVATAYASVLHENSTLKELDLTESNFTSAGLVSIAGALLHDSTMLERLRMKNSFDFTDDDEQEIAASTLIHLLQRNSTLREIDLDSTYHQFFSIGDTIKDGEQAGMLADAIRTNTSLERIILGGMWHLSDASANLFVTALSANHTVQYLSGKVGSNEGIQQQIEKLLSYNRMGPVTARARKTGKCPSEWFERSIPTPLTPFMFTRLEEIGGESSTSVLYHFVREHKSILALIKTCAETNRRKRKAQGRGHNVMLYSSCK